MFLSIFLLVAHWFALGYFALGRAELELPYCWLNLMDDTMGEDIFQCCGADNSTYNDFEKIFVGYTSSLYFTITSMTTIGFGNIAGNTDNEKMFCIVLMLFGSLLYAMIFGNVTTIFQQMSSQTTRYQNTLKSIRDFMKIYSVPKDLSERVMDYVISTWTLNKGVNTEQVLSYTPKDMRADLCIHLNRQVLHEHPAFRLASEGCLRALAIAFQMQHNAPGDLLFHTGESIEDLCFIANGSMEVLQDDEIVALVGKGDVIGDKFWSEPSVGQSACTVRALTYTDVHMISRDSLLQILQFYDSFRNSFERNMILTYNLRRYFSFKKIEDHEMEKKIAGARQQKERLEDMTSDHPVKKILKGLRERIAREVSQKSSESFECAKGGDSRRTSFMNYEETRSAKTEDLSTSKPASEAVKNDPKAPPMSNGTLPSTPRGLFLKSIQRSVSNLSAASVQSVSSEMSEPGLTSGGDTSRSTKNIWNKLASSSSRRRAITTDKGEKPSSANFASRDRLKSRKSNLDSVKAKTSPLANETDRSVKSTARNGSDEFSEFARDNICLVSLIKVAIATVLRLSLFFLRRVKV